MCIGFKEFFEHAGQPLGNRPPIGSNQTLDHTKGMMYVVIVTGNMGYLLSFFSLPKEFDSVTPFLSPTQVMYITLSKYYLDIFSCVLVNCRIVEGLCLQSLYTEGGFE